MAYKDDSTQQHWDDLNENFLSKRLTHGSITMQHIERIKKNKWKEKLINFSNVNAGRVATIESDSSIIIHNILFGNILYDPIFRENILKINMGIEQNEIIHTVLNPVVIIITKNNKNIDISLEIVNSDGDTIFLYFKD